MNDLLERAARAVWAKRPDCQGKPWPIQTPEQKRAYPHNPIAVVDLCYAYAKAVLLEASVDVEPVPKGVYYSTEHDNFYHAEAAPDGMGQVFWNRWCLRCSEFPKSAEEAK